MIVERMCELLLYWLITVINETKMVQSDLCTYHEVHYSASTLCHCMETFF